MAKTSKTNGSEDKIICPICWKSMHDLWEVNFAGGPFALRCEHCDSPLLINGTGTEDWEVQAA